MGGWAGGSRDPSTAVKHTGRKKRAPWPGGEVKVCEVAWKRGRCAALEQRGGTGAGMGQEGEVDWDEKWRKLKAGR